MQISSSLEGHDASDLEHAELIARSDRVEQFTVRRTDALVELASLRGSSVQVLRIELALKPVPSVA